MTSVEGSTGELDLASEQSSGARWLVPNGGCWRGCGVARPWRLWRRSGSGRCGCFRRCGAAAGAPAAVSSAHQVRELAFGFGTHGAAVGSPAGVLLAGEGRLVAADAHAAPAGGAGAEVSQLAACARPPGAGRVRAVPVGAGDCAAGQVDVEAVLGEAAPRSARRLGAAPRVDAAPLQQPLELAAAVGAVAMDRRPPLRTLGRQGTELRVAANPVA